MAKGKKSLGSVRAKAGLPAKAGRRKVYGHGSKPKQKTYGLGEGFIMKERQNNDENFHTQEEWSRIRSDAKRLAKDFQAISVIEKTHKLVSDPFVFNRMRAHAKAGIYPT